MLSVHMNMGFFFYDIESYRVHVIDKILELNFIAVVLDEMKVMRKHLNIYI